MYRQVCQLVLVTIICSISGISINAQDENSLAEQTVDRVIKLQSSEPPAAPVPKTVTPVVSSRVERVARQTLELPDPTKIQFEEINRETNPHPPEQPQPRLLVPPQQDEPVQAPQMDLAASPQPQVDLQLSPLQNSRAYLPAEQGAEQADSGNSSVITTMAPQISTRIMAPKFVNVGQSTPIRIQLQNVSQQSAQGVKLIATLPGHAKFVSSLPTPSHVEGQQYEFNVGQIGSRQLLEVQIEMVTQEKRPLELATRVEISEQQNIAVGVRQPKLNIELVGPQQANTGQWISHVLTIANVGDGIAENVHLIREHPTALHVEQSQLEVIVRQIAPGETKQLELKSFAESAGKFDLGFAIMSNGLETQKLIRPVTVRQPKLQVSAFGPKMNFVNRDGIYTIQIENSGEVDVAKVKVSLNVAKGMEVTTINRPAKVNPKTDTIDWFFDKIKANSQEIIQLKAVSKIAGQQICEIGIQSDETQSDQVELVTQVIARADVSIRLTNHGGPIEVGGQTEFVVSVSNQGSSPAAAVEVKVELAASLMAVSQDHYSVSELDNTIRFSTQDVAPGETKEFHFSAVGVAAGEHVVRSIVKMDDSERALMAEDSVFVFEAAQAKVSESLEPTIHRHK